MARQSTRIESEGAEFLVLGQLLIAGIPSYKCYTNMPGYDIVATNPEANSSARISVKSRWRTNAEGFIIKNFDCDFVVIVKLNRGTKDGRGEIMAPDFFVVPIARIQDLPRSGWDKISFRQIPDLENCRDRWHAIRDFLKMDRRSFTSADIHKVLFKQSSSKRKKSATFTQSERRR
jgi:hypothetical protein